MAAAFRCPICGGVVETDIQIGNLAVYMSFYCRKCGEYLEYDITDEYLTRAANARLDFARKVERIEGEVMHDDRRR